MKDNLPFGASITVDYRERLILLPSPRAALLKKGDDVLLCGPHSGIHAFDEVEWHISVRPEMVKLLFGRVQDFVEKTTTQADLPVLDLFMPKHTEEELAELLRDGRRSTTAIWDETLFTRWWTDGKELNHLDRRLQRICRRYGGQSPRKIRSQEQLGIALLDYVDGGRLYLEEFSDQSHFIRTCRECTRRTPRQIKKMSGTFYC